jgi:hypothetical protein
MLDVDIKNIKSLLKMGLIHVNMVYPIRKDAHFRLENDLKITLSNGYIIQIPRNFEFDGSSSPRFLWWALPSYGNFFFAALIHDYLYLNQYMHTNIGYKQAQKLADKEMLIWSNEINENKLDNKLRYWAVRLFGRKAYRT